MGLVGYFTAEIGLWSELHTYSGGLGVLAGDHVKSAADAEIDLIGVTLLYREGYGRQHIDIDGNQTETFGAIDPADHLIDTGLDLTLPLDGGTIHAKIWKVEVVGVTGHVVPVREVRISAGAGFIVVVCGEIMTMPGLPRKPAAETICVNADGEIEGLF